MTTTNTGMRTLSGVRFFISDTATLAQTSTNIVARPISRPFCADVVVASVGHMPSSNTNVGFSLTMPFVIIFSLFIFLNFVFCYLFERSLSDDLPSVLTAFSLGLTSVAPSALGLAPVDPSALGLAPVAPSALELAPVAPSLSLI